MALAVFRKAVFLEQTNGVRSKFRKTMFPKRVTLNEILL